jgi:hypothetical protein
MVNLRYRLSLLSAALLRCGDGCCCFALRFVGVASAAAAVVGLFIALHPSSSMDDKHDLERNYYLSTLLSRDGCIA